MSGGVRSIVVCMSVCLSVCLSTRTSQKPHVQISRNFLYVLPMSVARFFSDDNTIFYILPVLWMTSCFHMVHIKWLGGSGHRRAISTRPHLTLSENSFFSGGGGLPLPHIAPPQISLPVGGSLPKLYSSPPNEPSVSVSASREFLPDLRNCSRFQIRRYNVAASI